MAALPAHLPTPDPDLTGELTAATADAHAAAHMCLAVLAGSVNSYDGEFVADVDQANKHLTAAQELINKALTHALVEMRKCLSVADDQHRGLGVVKDGMAVRSDNLRELTGL